MTSRPPPPPPATRPLENNASLFNLSLKSVCLSIDPDANLDSVDHIYFLPHQVPPGLQRDFRHMIKLLWMFHSTPQEPPTHFNYCDIDLSMPLDKDEFIQVTKHPDDDHPGFWPYHWPNVAHVYRNYFTMSIVDTDVEPMNLCEKCFFRKCSPDPMPDEYFDYEQYWKDMGWVFHNKVEHYPTTPRRFVSTELKSPSRWCDWCILTPLFQLYNWDSCENHTRIHDYSDSDDDEIKTVFTTSKLYNPHFM